MSVNTLPKFNRAGLSGTTFGQRSSAKTTSGTSRQKTSSSISVSSRSYSLKNKKNYKYTAGTEISRGTTADYTALRRTNSTRGVRYSSSIDSSFITNAAINMGMIQGAYGMQSGGISTGMSILNSISSVGQTLFGGVQQSQSAALDSSMSGLSGGKLGIGDISDPGLSTAALAMTGATDYQSLSTAINSAESKLSSFEAQGPAIKSAAQDATKNLSSLEGGVKAAENAKTTASNNVGKAKQGVQGAEAGRTKAQGNLTKATQFEDAAQTKYASAKGAHATANAANQQAKTNLTSCTNAHNDAQTALTNAKTTLANTPKEIDGPNGQKIPNPAYAQAENAVKMAEAKEEATKNALDQAQTKKNQTQTALDNAEKELSDAEKNLEQNKKDVVNNDDALNKAIKECETAETEVGKAEQGVREAEVQEKEMTAQYDIAKDNCDKAKDAITTYKDYEQNATALRNTIKEQKSRLSTMGKTAKKNNTGRATDAEFATEVLAKGKGNPTSETLNGTTVLTATNTLTGKPVHYNKQTGKMISECEYNKMKTNTNTPS